MPLSLLPCFSIFRIIEKTGRDMEKGKGYNLGAF